MDLKILNIDEIVNSGNNIPTMVDFDKIGFFKKKTTSKGLVNRCQYYEQYDGTTYTNLIVDVTYEYITNQGLTVGQTTTINWIDVNEQIGFTKVFPKIFLPWEIVDFGVGKRTNILSSAKLYVLSTIGRSNGEDLLDELIQEMGKYTEGKTPQEIVDKVNSLVATKSYLTQSIANNINAILSDI